MLRMSYQLLAIAETLKLKFSWLEHGPDECHDAFLQISLSDKSPTARLCNGVASNHIRLRLRSRKKCTAKRVCLKRFNLLRYKILSANHANHLIMQF